MDAREIGEKKMNTEKNNRNILFCSPAAADGLDEANNC